jgi:TorA maturation chaperone TorD
MPKLEKLSQAEAHTVFYFLVRAVIVFHSSEFCRTLFLNSNNKKAPPFESAFLFRLGINH